MGMKENREIVILGIMIVALFVMCYQFSADYEAMQKKASYLETNMENIHKSMNSMKESLKGREDRLDFFEVMDRALTMGVIKHRHYENGEVYLGPMKECKKYCRGKK